ncbi:bifunctional 4'-phosphopantothenoylcysteine decarboxylase/phosphopantothenoylcysteine synthetase [Finegoldia magna]|uniref:Coenzyme A biosynthesis bifunctional protein CoaBC n=1 Tax=Finegoldia magna TaxID=1260 RepID=A0A233V4Z3_FINMA|nr:bifunctional phosphopantothenoylcysteine decarboxylase/phosphopantothenate--cysteine ligase CoaBC [Finegoldia magna]MDU5223267.1 bifunctional phosphopantothenoylcysteine decarboxylase/phosphopantothenate--cysteine ligase CoaBC [Finegoldia magna]OXZ27458.1 bifunctional 4'-phosphopantothenoylcysteine decarboxylase/phosphopantothenoylcysteine synthetase [Finegoldia magna]
MSKNILLGVTGGIAIYKVVDVVSRLKKLDYNIKIIMTDSACEFVSPMTFETIGKCDVKNKMFHNNSHKVVEHIELAKWADLFLIAPASANTMAKINYGIADDLLSSTALAYAKPIMFCVSMNTNMLNNPATQKNIEDLKQKKHLIVDSNSGMLACNTEGNGRLKEPWEIVEEVEKYFCEKDLQGKKILITAGATVERIDPVRYITNDSSGKMGYSIAKKAFMRGADVTIISGKTTAENPYGIKNIKVESAIEMKEKIESYIGDFDSLIMAAAVSDFKVKNRKDLKIKKQDGINSLELEENPDILKSLNKKDNQIFIGFAAETNNLLENAKKKLDKKNLDFIVLNDVSKKDIGFNSEYNKVTVISKDNILEIDKDTKLNIADKILDLIK